MDEVKIYTTPPDPCQTAKEFLSQRGVPFTDLDVTKDRQALQDMIKISGGRSKCPPAVNFTWPLVMFSSALPEA